MRAVGVTESFAVAEGGLDVLGKVGVTASLKVEGGSSYTASKAEVVFSDRADEGRRWEGGSEMWRTVGPSDCELWSESQPTANAGFHFPPEFES